jgi:hypothetical protein
MTVKQKAARAKFTKAIAEAKKLRAKNPKLTQAAAVKQAFAILYSKDKPKKVGAVKKKAAPKKKAAVKKAAPKKKAAAKKPDSVHKDTNSHNVKIHIVSGVIKAKPSIIALSKKIQKLTEYNDHNKAVLELAKFLKHKKFITGISNIQKIADNLGYMPSELISLRRKVLSELLSQLKAKYGEIDYKLIYHSY